VENLLTAREVAKLLNCAASTVYKMASLKQLRCIRWEVEGNGTEKPRPLVRFKMEDVLRFIDEHST
jgi:excisionase family DNA binding protein